jgi:pimeloyl-ACP methyl ester carboxylesterase
VPLIPVNTYRARAALRMVLGTLLAACAWAQAPPGIDPLGSDPPPDAAHPPAMVQLTVPSHGADLFGVYYRAAGAAPHATVVLLHGFPGFEQNEDLAQAARRAGFNVFIFHYRGAWGSGGSYSFTHCIEDVESMLAYLRVPANAARLGVDRRRLVLVGHSVGGHIAGIVAARDPGVVGVAMISAANRRLQLARPGGSAELRAHFQAQLAPLSGADAGALVAELTAHASDWDLPELAPRWRGRAVLIVFSEGALTAAVRATDPAHLTQLHLPTDHAYSGARVALARALIAWLEANVPAPR